MKTLFKIIIIHLVLLCANIVLGQELQLTVIAVPPHPSLLSEFQEGSDNYRLNIVNLNPNKEHNIILTGRLTSDNGIEAELSEDYNNFEIINVPAGSNQTFLFEELGNYFDDLTLNDIDYSGGPDVDYLIQSQRLPDGVYNICLEARDFDSRELLSLPMEANCSNPIIIQSINPPTLINPLEGETINQTQPTFFNINWTPVLAPSASIVYDLRLAEYSELINPYDAVENENFIQFEERNLRSTVFMYNQAHTPLVEGRQYIIRVRARDENGSVNIFNQGWSDIVLFTFGNDGLSNDNNQNQEGTQDGNYSCMSPCVSVDIPDVPAIPSISIGDIFRIGHFNLQINDFQQTIDGYTGRGIIKASDFIPMDINVAFENIQINERNMITSGMVNGLRKAVADAFPRVNEVLVDGNVDQLLIDQMYDELLAPAAEIISDDINEVLDEIEGAISLPFSFGDGEYKIHIPDMRFTAEGATVSMLTGFELEGDFIEGSRKLVFGSPEICITPGGLSLTDEVLKLEILSSVDYTPSEVFSLHINGVEGDRRSYIDIDCDGLNAIELNGHLSFDQDFVVGVDANGNSIRNKKFATSFSASFTDWDEMIFTTHNEVQGMQDDLLFASSFEVRELPDFKFNFEQMIIDLSEANNAEQMQFPFLEEANWIGLYFKNIQMQLPDYFEQGATKVNLDVSDLLIDDAGVSFDFTGSNLEALTDLTFGGWGIDINQINIRLLRNLLATASISGQVDLPICDNPIGISGRMQRVDNRMDYNLGFDVREKWEVPMWACKFKCNRQSRLIADVEDGNFILKARLSGDLELNDAISDFDKVSIDNIRFEDMEFLTEAPYFRPGNFDIDAVVNAEFYGFNVNLEDIEVGQINKPNVRGKLPKISFDLGFKFGSKGNNVEGMYFSSDSRLNITGKRNFETGKYSFDAIALERLEIESQVATVRLNGYLNIYHNHNVYGDGIGGGLRARFLGMQADMNADVLFGNVSNYDYWYVNAGAVFNQGITLSPIQIKGFSGGAFYNMNQTVNHNASIGQESATYIPRRGGWGFRAGTVWATMGEDNMLNGNVNLSVDFQASGALNRIVLDGRAKMLDDPSFTREEIGDTEMLFQGSIAYNHVRRSLSGSFGYRLDIPRGHGVINGGRLDSRNISFNIDSPNDWNFNLGLPRPDGRLTDMLGFNLDLGIKIKNKFIGVRTGFQGYFNVGTSIPSTPPLPPRAREVVGPGFNIPQRNRAGVGTGLHVAFETGKIKFGYDIVGLSIRAYAGLGYDVSFMDYSGNLCNGRDDFGINNWYFHGQAYAYAGGDLYGRLFGSSYHILHASVGAYLGAAGPDPYYATGRLRVRGRLPVIGWKTIYLGVKVGEKCEFTPIPGQDEAFLNDLAETMVLEELSGLPEGDVDFTDSSVKIRADFFKKPNWIYTEYFAGGEVLQYKVDHILDIREWDNGEWVQKASTNDINHIKYQSGRVDVFLNQTNDNQRILSPGRRYKVSVRGTLKYRKSYNGAFKIAKDQDDENITIRREFRFSTTELGDFDLDILEITPSPNQLYYHKGDALFGNGLMRMSNENLQMLNRLGYGRNANLEFKFTEFRDWYRNEMTGEVDSLTGYYVAGDTRERFRVNGLNNGSVYQMEIFLEYEDENPIRLYTQYFGTSRYSTLDEKLESVSTNRVTESGGGPNGARYTIEIIGNEAFQSPYEDIKLRYLANGRLSWDERRNAMEIFARDRGFLNTVQLFNPEFVSIPIQNQVGFNILENIVPIGLNFDPFGAQEDDDEREPAKLRYEWRPNDYMAALRSHAIQNHFVEINADAQLRELFFSNYVPLNTDDYRHSPWVQAYSTDVEGAVAELPLRF